MSGVLCNNECLGCGGSLIHDFDMGGWRGMIKIQTVLPIFTSGPYPEVIEDVVDGNTPTPVVCTDCYTHNLLSLSAKSSVKLHSSYHTKDWGQCCNCGSGTRKAHIACQVSEMRPAELEPHMINGESRTLISAEPSGGQGHTVCLGCMAEIMVDAAAGAGDVSQPLSSLFLFAEQMGAWDCDEFDELNEYNNGWETGPAGDEKDPNFGPPF